MPELVFASTMLFDRVADAIFLIGADEDTGLQQFERTVSLTPFPEPGYNLQSPDQSFVFENEHSADLSNSNMKGKQLEEKNFKPNIIYTITRNLCFQQSRSLNLCPFYPPASFREPKSDELLRHFTGTTEEPAANRPTELSHRSSILRQFRRKTVTFVPERSQMEEAAMLPKNAGLRNPSMSRQSIRVEPNNPSAESVRNASGIVSLLYPEGFQILPLARRSQAWPRLELVPLTDVAGARTFATGITFYRPFRVSEENDSLDDEQITESSGDNGEIFLLPTTILLLSKQNCCTVIGRLLSHQLAPHRLAETDVYTIEGNELRRILFHLSATLTRLPLLQIKNKFDLDVVLKPTLIGQINTTDPPSTAPLKHLLPLGSVDGFDTELDLRELFACLSVKRIQAALLALWTEARIVMLGRDRFLVTKTTQALLDIFKPFRWQFTYIAWLPKTLHEILGAPGPFLIGFDSDHAQLAREKVGEQPTLLVNLDSDEAAWTADIDWRAALAPELTELERKLKSAGCLDRPPGRRPALAPATTLAEAEKRDAEDLGTFRHHVHACIQECLFQPLFGNAKRFIRIGSIDSVEEGSNNFDKSQFLLSVPDRLKLFYERIVDTQHFYLFVHENTKPATDSVQEEFVIELSFAALKSSFYRKIMQTLRDKMNLLEASAPHSLALQLFCADLLTDITVNDESSKPLNKSLVTFLAGLRSKLPSRRALRNMSKWVEKLKQYKNSSVDDEIPNLPRLTDEILNDDFSYDNEWRMRQVLCCCGFGCDPRIHKALHAIFSRERDDPDKILTFGEAWADAFHEIRRLNQRYSLPDHRANEVVVKCSPKIRVDPITYGRVLLTQRRLLVIPDGNARATFMLYYCSIFSVSLDSENCVKVEAEDTQSTIILYLREDRVNWCKILTLLIRLNKHAMATKTASLLENFGVELVLARDALPPSNDWADISLAELLSPAEFASPSLIHRMTIHPCLLPELGGTILQVSTLSLNKPGLVVCDVIEVVQLIARPNSNHVWCALNLTTMHVDSGTNSTGGWLFEYDEQSYTLINMLPFTSCITSAICTSDESHKLWVAVADATLHVFDDNLDPVQDSLRLPGHQQPAIMLCKITNNPTIVLGTVSNRLLVYANDKCETIEPTENWGLLIGLHAMTKDKLIIVFERILIVAKWDRSTDQLDVLHYIDSTTKIDSFPDSPILLSGFCQNNDSLMIATQTDLFTLQLNQYEDLVEVQPCTLPRENSCQTIVYLNYDSGRVVLGFEDGGLFISRPRVQGWITLITPEKGRVASSLLIDNTLITASVSDTSILQFWKVNNENE